MGRGERHGIPRPDPCFGCSMPVQWQRLGKPWHPGHPTHSPRQRLRKPCPKPMFAVLPAADSGCNPGESPCLSRRLPATGHPTPDPSFLCQITGPSWLASQILGVGTYAIVSCPSTSPLPAFQDSNHHMMCVSFYSLSGSRCQRDDQVSSSWQVGLTTSQAGV